MRDATEKGEDASEQLTEDFMNILPDKLKTKLNEVGEELIKMDKGYILENVTENRTQRFPQKSPAWCPAPQLQLRTHVRYRDRQGTQNGRFHH